MRSQYQGQQNLGQLVIQQLANSTQYNSSGQPMIGKSSIVSADMKRKLYDTLVPLENLGLIQTTKDQIIYTGPPFSCFDYVNEDSINYNYSGKNAQMLLANYHQIDDQYQQKISIGQAEEQQQLIQKIKQLQQDIQQLQKQLNSYQQKQIQQTLNYNDIIRGCQIIINKKINQKQKEQSSSLVISTPFQNTIYSRPDFLIVDKIDRSNIKLYEPLPIEIQGNKPNLQLEKYLAINIQKPQNQDVKFYYLKNQQQFSPSQQITGVITMTSPDIIDSSFGVTPFLEQLRNLE